MQVYFWFLITLLRYGREYEYGWERNRQWSCKRVHHARIVSEASEVIQNTANMALYKGQNSQDSNCWWVLNSFHAGHKTTFKGWFQPAAIAIAGTGIGRGYPVLLCKDAPLKHLHFADITHWSPLSSMTLRYISYPLCFIGENLKYRKNKGRTDYLKRLSIIFIFIITFVSFSSLFKRTWCRV